MTYSAKQSTYKHRIVHGTVPISSSPRFLQPFTLLSHSISRSGQEAKRLPEATKVQRGLSCMVISRKLLQEISHVQSITDWNTQKYSSELANSMPEKEKKDLPMKKVQEIRLAASSVLINGRKRYYSIENESGRFGIFLYFSN